MIDTEVLEGILYLISLFWPVLIPILLIALIVPFVVIKWVIIWKISKKVIETRPTRSN